MSARAQATRAGVEEQIKKIEKDRAAWVGVVICAPVYRPRRARESPFLRLVEPHLSATIAEARAHVG